MNTELVTTAIFGGTAEMKEKQFYRLLKSKEKEYFVEEQANAMIEYAKQRGVTIEKETLRVGYTYYVLRVK